LRDAFDLILVFGLARAVNNLSTCLWSAFRRQGSDVC